MTEAEIFFPSNTQLHPYKYAGTAYSPRLAGAPMVEQDDGSGYGNVVIGGRAATPNLARGFFGRSATELLDVLPEVGLGFAASEAISRLVISADADAILRALTTLLQPNENLSISNNLQAVAQALDFLENAYRQGGSEITQRSIVSTIQTLFGWIAEGSYTIIDSILKFAKVEDLAPEITISLVRATNRVSNHLPNWKIFLSRARTDFLLRGLDATELLQGL